MRLRQRRGEASGLRIKELEMPDPVAVYRGAAGGGGHEDSQRVGVPSTTRSRVW